MKNNLTIAFKNAKHMGFCVGVSDAVDTLSGEIIKKESIVYVLGMIVHNEFVVNYFKEQGVYFINENDVLNGNIPLKKGDEIIIRAHGTTKEIKNKLSELGVIIKDKACVYVKSARDNLIKYENLGYTPIFIGDKDHPEVKGIASYSKNTIIFQDLDHLSLSNIDKDKKYAFLAQTTYNKFLFMEIEKHIKEYYKNSVVLKTICGATHQRQNSVQKIAKDVDFMLIIGSTKSSNSKKLYSIAKNINKNTFFVNDVNDVYTDEFNSFLFKRIFNNVNELTYLGEDLDSDIQIGVSAGASTPDDMINIIKKNIINKIKNINKTKEMKK